MIKMKEIRVFSTANALFTFAAEDFANRAISAVASKGSFSVVLSGGSTPKSFFDHLSQDDHYKKIIPWQHIKFFFGDERYVPSDDTESNYYTANKHLFSQVPVNQANIYPIPTTFTDPKTAAEHYQQTIGQALKIKDNELPTFDLVYLGLGDDAHTASLMPFSDIVRDYAHKPPLADPNKWVVAFFAEKFNMYRITLTPNIINHSQSIIFLVANSSKAAAIKHVLEDATDALSYPAQLISEANWYLDQDAASKLTMII